MVIFQFVFCVSLPGRVIWQWIDSEAASCGYPLLSVAICCRNVPVGVFVGFFPLDMFHHVPDQYQDLI
jgi:hypothetical protein